MDRELLLLLVWIDRPLVWVVSYTYMKYGAWKVPRTGDIKIAIVGIFPVLLLLLFPEKWEDFALTGEGEIHHTCCIEV